jgi:hypothetical protein
MMNNMDLENLIHRRLQELPMPAAPPSLFPRVLAAVQRRLERPWYERSWPNWPRPLQVLSVAALATVFAGLVALEPLLGTAWNAILSSFDPAMGQIWGDIRASLRAAEVFRRALVVTGLGYVAVLGFMMGTACAMLGAALTRVAGLGGASES